MKLDVFHRSGDTGEGSLCFYSSLRDREFLWPLDSSTEEVSEDLTPKSRIIQ